MIWSAITEALGLGRETIRARSAARVAKIEARAAIETARATAAQRQADHAANWEQLAISDAATSWKDEWFVILLSIPLVLSFIPGAAPIVSDGFAAMEQVPDWYRWGVLSAIGFSFGRRVLPNWLSKGGK